MEQFSQDQKIDLLKTVYDQLHNSRRDKEALEKKIAFSVSAIFLGLTSLSFKENFKIPENNEWIILLAIITITGLSISILILNSITIQKWCQLIVRIEQIFGLYDSTIYIDKDKVHSFSNIPYAGDTVFPEEVMHWGSGNRFQSIIIHVAIVFLTGLLAVFSVFL